MGFAAAVKSFWSNYTTFSGRARRSEYWFIQLFLLLTNLAAAAIDLALMNGDVDRLIANGGGGIVGLSHRHTGLHRRRLSLWRQHLWRITQGRLTTALEAPA